MWHSFFNWFVKITGVIPQYFLFHTKIYYENKQVQSNVIRGKAIVFANHHSVFDVAVMMFVFWRRTLHCLVAELMYRKNWFMSVFLKFLGSIKVDRDAKDFSFITKSCAILNRGGVIEIYPESRIPRPEEERPLPFKPSLAYIALLSDAPMIPVYTNGSYFRKEPARVMIGTPIYARDLYNDTLSEKENLEQISKYLRNKIIELSYELERQTNEEKEKNNHSL